MYYVAVYHNFIKVKAYCGSRSHNVFDENSRYVYRSGFENIRVHFTGYKFHEYCNFDFIEVSFFLKFFQYSAGYYDCIDAYDNEF